MNARPLLEAREISSAYGHMQALHDVGFRVGHAETVELDVRPLSPAGRL